MNHDDLTGGTARPQYFMDSPTSPARPLRPPGPPLSASGTALGVQPLVHRMAVLATVSHS
jgi:hypothetical protein